MVLLHSLLGISIRDSLFASTRKVNDAIHQLKKVCIRYKLSFLSRCIISYIFASVKNMYLYIIIICTLLKIICDQNIVCRLIFPLQISLACSLITIAAT